MIPYLPRWLVRGALYPTYRNLRGDRILDMLEAMRQSQWLPASDLQELRWKRLMELLKTITATVPHYRDLFRVAGLSAEDIRTPADFLNVPLLTKEDIRKAAGKIITEDGSRKGIRSNTSGSTGEPLFFHCDLASRPVRRGAALLGNDWMGVGIGDRIAYISGFHLDRPLVQRAVGGLKNYLNSKIYFSSFDMSEERMATYARALAAFKPDLIEGYPSAVSLLADFCRRHRVTNVRPRAVVSSGERIFPHQAEMIKEAFGAPVFDRYGSNEFSITAQECDKHEGLHLINDYLYVEVLMESGRPAESGETGEIVVTDLSNLYMPFVRYRTGDLGVPAARKCSCGRGSPVLQRIEGRTFNVVVTSDGRTTGGYFWTYLSRLVPGIRQFQIEQKARTGVTFKIVPGPEWKEAYKLDLEKKIKDKLGQSFAVSFELLDDIPLTPAGKFRFIWSRIEERLVVKSKIHKARVTGENPDGVDGIVIDEDLLDFSNLAPLERVLVVNNVNGARLETPVLKGRRGSGEIVMSGGGTHHAHTGDEIIVMAFGWSEESQGVFKNILVDENNKFVRYLVEIAGEKL